MRVSLKKPEDLNSIPFEMFFDKEGYGAESVIYSCQNCRHFISSVACSTNNQRLHSFGCSFHKLSFFKEDFNYEYKMNNDTFFSCPRHNPL